MPTWVKIQYSWRAEESWGLNIGIMTTRGGCISISQKYIYCKERFLDETQSNYYHIPGSTIEDPIRLEQDRHKEQESGGSTRSMDSKEAVVRAMFGPIGRVYFYYKSSLDFYTYFYMYKNVKFSSFFTKCGYNNW